MKTKPSLSILFMIISLLTAHCTQQQGLEQFAQSPSSAEIPTPAQPAPEPPEPQFTIRTGTYFGLCVGYCQEELAISSLGLIYTQKSNEPNDAAYPDRVETVPFTTESWQGLGDKVDMAAFNALPTVIGCPDCADGGGEWVEISTGQTTKRVEFERDTSVPEIDDLLRELRKLREELSSKYNP